MTDVQRGSKRKKPTKSVPAALPVLHPRFAGVRARRLAALSDAAKSLGFTLTKEVAVGYVSGQNTYRCQRQLVRSCSA